MRILVLGGYGLIGHAVVRALADRGHDVTGLGRDMALARRLLPEIPWIEADLSTMTRSELWRPLIAPFACVVNAAGALQDGARDRVAAVQDAAVRALIAACRDGGVRTFVQISAPGASRDATTAFLRTKAAADDALRQSGLDWVILKPGLVISPNAYGGTALVRSLAAFPVVQPLVLPYVPIATVSVAEVARAAVMAAEGELPPHADYDLMEAQPGTLAEVVGRFRGWLGFPRSRAQVVVPPWVGRSIALAADAAGWLGWRSPLRTTSLRVLQSGITGDPRPWQAVAGAPVGSLAETLRRMPATAQERIYARTQLLLPVLILALALFWIASGVIGLLRPEATSAIISGTFPPATAMALVSLFSIADIAIGASLLVRRLARAACLAAVALTAGYLIAASIFLPELWLDPLGPLVKTLPAALLALTVRALLEER